MRLTVQRVMRSLLPSGTEASGKRKVWHRCPLWAPDVFAVSATLADISGCYAEPGIALSRSPRERTAKQKRAANAKKWGKQWASRAEVPKDVQVRWDTLIAHEKSLVCEVSPEAVVWKRAALDLLAIADECCAGVGYIPEEGSDDIRQFLLDELIAYNFDQTQSPLQIPHSIAHLVPPDVACVLPKALTPEVGCTLRSLSHNLALLPSQGVVKARWDIGPSRSRLVYPDKMGPLGQHGDDGKNALNLLLIPFPYVVFGTDFKIAGHPEEATDKFAAVDGYFDLTQGWLKKNDEQITASDLACFVQDLIQSAQREVKFVHGIIFPEAALSQDLALGLAAILAKQFPNLELIIAGTLRADTLKSGEKRNEAALIQLQDRKIVGTYVQSKHHRWRLNEGQIKQYQLGHVLDPVHNWWEKIDVQHRSIQFGLNRHEAIISALICEDLARYDPVQPLITSVGPSLVVALLMDGPQLEARWSARYATVLAEDPGSSVLTLTCLGMILRSRLPGQEVRRAIGLWKDRDGPATQLVLPAGDYGILLSLVGCKPSEQRTLDLRSDGAAVVEYRLGGVRSVGLKEVPDWLRRDSMA